MRLIYQFIQQLCLPSTFEKAEDTLVTVTNKAPASWSTSDRVERKCLGAKGRPQLAECLHSPPRSPGTDPSTS